jgi:hypothetical protein
VLQFYHLDNPADYSGTVNHGVLNKIAPVDMFWQLPGYYNKSRITGSCKITQLKLKSDIGSSATV